MQPIAVRASCPPFFDQQLAIAASCPPFFEQQLAIAANYPPLAMFKKRYSGHSEKFLKSKAVGSLPTLRFFLC
ncbi:MAG: hypothetical protein HYZ45_02200 [Burkholderiales bacterium]|nr:hypothetical protein [Burkholderiales bacterium]